MPLHPQAKAVLDMFSKMMPPLGSLTPQEMRKAMAFPPAPGPAMARVTKHYVPGPGGPVPVRLYTPVLPSPGFDSGPYGALVWFHGGGWVLGTLDQADGVCRHLADKIGCVVVNVDYRLAPETKFPGPVEDCYAATKWIHDNAEYFNVVADKIAVGGDSAGGNLAAAVAQMARDKGGLKISAQLLAYPVTDRNYDTKSYKDNAAGYLLTKDSMKWFWDLYLSKDADAKNPYAAPLQAKNFKGLAPAIVFTAEFDPLRDEGEAYAKKLEEAGVQTVCKRYNGQIHGFFGMPGMDDGAKAVAEASDFVKKAFGPIKAAPKAKATAGK
ncbi:MAG: alpha/beta hydrolase [Dehalococcoidia bacterium]|nr:alpha/beta hydrolase [Dehalococcoidia bacterium]